MKYFLWSICSPTSTWAMTGSDTYVRTWTKKIRGLPGTGQKVIPLDPCRPVTVRDIIWYGVEGWGIEVLYYPSPHTTNGHRSRIHGSLDNRANARGLGIQDLWALSVHVDYCISVTIFKLINSMVNKDIFSVYQRCAGIMKVWIL